MIEIIPAIDIIDGKCVRLVQGDFSRVRQYSDDPVETARAFEARGISRLHLVDLDGARSGSTKNLAVLESIAKATRLVIDFSGGLRSADQVAHVLDSGAQLACVGSVAVTAPDVFFGLIDRFGSDRIVLAADARDGKVAIDGWSSTSDRDLIQLLREYVTHGGSQALVTDISRDGVLKGPAVDLYRQIRDEVPDLGLIASGGVRSSSDVDDLERIGCTGAIIGKAIYEGLIPLTSIVGGKLAC